MVAKYNKETRKMIVSIRQENPLLTGKQIGDILGVSKQRVSQVLLSEQVETKRSIYKYECQNCGEAILVKRKYCNKCYFELHNVQLVCKQCGKVFWRRVCDVLKYESRIRSSYSRNSKYTFCSRQCIGKWLSSTEKKKDDARFLSSLKRGGTRIIVMVHNNGDKWTKVLSELDGNTVIKLITDTKCYSVRSACRHYGLKLKIYPIEGECYIDGRTQ